MPILFSGIPVDSVPMPTVVWDNVALKAEVWGATGNIPEAPNVAGPQTFDGWSPGVSTLYPIILFSMNPPLPRVDTVVIMGHNFFGRVTTVNIQFEDPSNLGTFVTFMTLTEANGGITADNRDVAILRANTGNLPLASQYRIKMYRTVGGTPKNVPADVRISNIFFGNRLVFDRGMSPDYTPPRRNKDIDLKTSVSLKGQFIANRGITMGVRGQANFNLHDWDWAQTNVVPFAEHFDKGGTFVWMGSPSDLSDDLTYARRDPSDPTFGMALTAGRSCRYAKMGMSFNGYLGA